MTMLRDWQQRCARKRAARDDLIPKSWLVPELMKSQSSNLLEVPTTCGVLTEQEIRITTDYDAVGIVAAIRDTTFTAEEVTTAFCKRAAIAQQLTNCLTEIFFDEAIECARSLDKQRKANPEKQLGPFHGLPISLKDSFKLKGKDATIGLVCFVGAPAEENSALVDLLQSLGAVLYCKTNVPQTMMTADSENNIFGRTLNPNNIRLTAGGSTGGEGALIVLRGSILGVGTDVAGSIRIPSSCNGIYGFKPTSDIVPYSGQQNDVVDGIVGIPPSAGPMATSIRSCQFFMETIMKARPSVFDCSVTKVPWLDLKPPRVENLRIGVIADDTLHTPTPPLHRALREAVQKLVAAGVTIVPIQLTDVQSNMHLIWDLFSIDGSAHLRSLLDSTKEPLVESVRRIGLTTTPGKSIEEYFQINHARSISSKKFNGMWKEYSLDAMLCLPAPHTATPFDDWTVITYTSLFNLFDCPAVIIPVGKVEDIDLLDEAARYGENDQRVYDLYSGPELYRDTPTTLQLIGQRHEDEKLAGVSVTVDGILNGR
ncbi:amidase [Mollisia scopiformis]|uniref:Amidase n=1 Tax=Mollisia scopiformis TaxID=149040 RepID=A0A194XLU4_MOLSC|nr:amidase [Mollisia scopiformis]KUJ21215.1 amidase [Mollisia scopiformis]